MNEKNSVYLMVLEGVHSGEIYSLNSLNTLGAAGDNTIILKDRRISDHHASIYQTNNFYWLYNRDPSNPICVNGQNIQKTPLHHRDIITLATTTLVYLEIREKFDEFSAIADKSLSPMTTEILHCVTPHNYSKILEGHLATRAGERLRVLMDVSGTISKIFDVEILLKKILSIIGKEFSADRGFIILLRPDRKCQVKAFFHRYKTENLDFSHSKFITRKVLARRTSMLYNQAAEQNVSSHNGLSCLSVPLNCKGKLLGLIQLEAFSGYKFTYNDLDQLRKIATQTAIAIENLEIHQRPIRYHQYLVSLERFSQSLSRHLNKEKIIQESVRTSTMLFKSTRVSVLLANNDRASLQIAYAIGIPEEEWKKNDISIKCTLAGLVYETNKPLLVTNTHKIPPAFRSQIRNICKYRSLSCILAPIPVNSYDGNKHPNIGIICVTDKQDGASFSILEKKLLVLLANQIGTALTNAELYEKATVDLLTRVYNRAYFFHKFQQEVYHAHRYGNSLSLIMLDIDYFKSINDGYSHKAGDCVLEQLGKLLQDQAEKNFFVGRYGGEEFVLCFRADRTQALTKAQSIQRLIASHHFDIALSHLISITSSIGVSTLRPTDTPHLLIERADRALYLAKEKGRNCVISETEVASD